MLEINQDFKNLIPALTQDEFMQLETNCVREGIREPLIVWGSVLIDGHNRYKIALDNNLPYETISKEFDNEQQVKEWMILNQFGRRNLSNYNRSVLALELEGIFQVKAKENLKASGENFGKGLANLPKAIDKVNTRETVANKADVSSRTIGMVKKIQAQATPELKEKLVSGEVSINEAYKEVKKIETKENIKNEILDKAKTNIIPSNIKLLEGDLFDRINDIENNSIDLLNTDPPYKILSNDWDTFLNDKDFLAFTERWLKLVIPKVKSTGRVYISFAQWYQYDFYNILKNNNFFGFNFKQNIIWYYKNNNKPSNQKEYRYMYEPIFYMYGKDAPVLNFTHDTYGEPHQNVWEIATPQSNFKEGKFHSAQKPLELYRRIIKTGSYDGGTVLDCFAGSGTTGIICKELNRDCILIEKDIENIEIIKGRL